MAIGFGAQAERFAARLSATQPAIVAGFDGSVSALATAIEWLRAGTRFWAAALIDEPRALVAQRVSGRWFEARTSIDDRYTAFDALAAGKLEDAGIETAPDDSAIDEPQRRVLRDFVITSDTLLVRSNREAERVSRILARRRPTVVTLCGQDLAVPKVVSAGGNSIVVWAPYLGAERLGVIAMALEYLRSPVVYVCASGALRHARGTFVRPAQAAAALASAACVIDASIGDPASAIALASLNVPVVATSTAGAAEYLDGVLEYDPWDWRTLFAAVSAARGCRAPRPKRDTFISAVTAAPATGSKRSKPLVNVVVLTYNRRDLLPLALDSIARQSYDNLEIIVVNNGGCDISDIVQRYPGARLITLPENLLPNDALDIGLAACRGEYFGVLSDDDELFPAHFDRLVDALETSQAEVAHSNSVTRYLSMKSGARETLAYRVRADRPSDRLQILVGGTMAFHSMLFRTSVRTALGGLQIGLAPADLEYTVRAAQYFDFVHVDAVTCEWNYVIEGTSYTHRDNMYEGLKEIYAKYPANGSRIVETRRRAELERFSERNAGKALWPPDLLLNSGTRDAAALNRR